MDREYIELLTKLVSIPSVSQNERQCAEFLAEELERRWGRQVETETGMRAEVRTEVRTVEENSCNVIARLKGRAGSEAGKKLLLGGHIDTVPPAAGWQTDPFCLSIQEDRAYGLGAADMKGGLAAQIIAVERFLREGGTFDGEIELVGLCDEERHSIGANDYVENMTEAGREAAADFAIFGEPHFDHIVVGATGKILLRLDIKGEAGHATNPETGISAIDCMIDFLRAIREKYEGPYLAGMSGSHCVLRVESRYEGYSLNIPENCFALLNKQLTVNEDASRFVSELLELYREQVGKGKATIHREIPYYPSYQIPPENEPLHQLLELLRTDYGTEPELRINQSVSDGNVLYPKLGIPTILFGPKGCDYHKANEYLELPSAYLYIEMLNGFLNRFFKSSD